jgi:hypothetical protein
MRLIVLFQCFRGWTRCRGSDDEYRRFSTPVTRRVVIRASIKASVNGNADEPRALCRSPAPLHLGCLRTYSKSGQLG